MRRRRPGDALPGRPTGGPRACRGLQVTLGLTWLLDAALQYQPSMFTRAFPVMMLAPGGGRPAGHRAGPVTLAARLVAASPAAWNAAFATVQLALAAGLFFRRHGPCRAGGHRRLGAVGMVARRGARWHLHRRGQPADRRAGAALLYALLAVLIWPVRARGPPGAGSDSTRARGLVSPTAGPLGRGARLAWFFTVGGHGWLMAARAGAVRPP